MFIVEHRQRVRLYTEDGEPYEEDYWKEVDSLGGCYLDETYGALEVAKEHFDI